MLLWSQCHEMRAHCAAEAVAYAGMTRHDAPLHVYVLLTACQSDMEADAVVVARNDCGLRLLVAVTLVGANCFKRAASLTLSANACLTTCT